MSWIVSILVGVITGAFGLVYAGLVAFAAIKWLAHASADSEVGQRHIERRR
jgi:hypothetical protein